jgi:hypothetical protein
MAVVVTENIESLISVDDSRSATSWDITASMW